MKTVFLAHAAEDHEFACRLAPFLELGSDVACSAEEGLVAAGDDLLRTAEKGLASDVLVLMLSDASWPAPLRRDRWERILFEEPERTGTELVSLLVRDCPFPAILRRRNFIDAAGPLAAMRLLKRWIRNGSPSEPALSPDLADLYRRLADQSGAASASGALASRFVKAAAQDFDAVLWIPCHGRSLAQITGEIGAQLGLVLDSEVEENLRVIHDLLARRRCLLVLDAPAAANLSALQPNGRTSTLITSEPVHVPTRPQSLADARQLIVARRYAEAYEMLYQLMDAGVARESCARELSWICEHWNRVEEAGSLRSHYRLPPTEQLSLF